MKIRIITCHDVYNYGASLQAYALSHYLITLGHDAKIIDYKPKYQRGSFSLTAINNPKYDKPIIRQLYIIAKLWERINNLKRKATYDKFTKKFQVLTKRYNSYEELYKDPPVADLYVAGSDQIWNSLFPTGRDKAFYLEFVKSNARKISYAASFSIETISSEYHNFVRDQLQNFDSISVREKEGLDILYSLGIKSGIVTCDPVFLIPKRQWDKLGSLSKLTIPDKYILIYICSHNPFVLAKADKLRQESGLKIVTLGYSHISDINITNANPIDFLYLVKNAQYVITDSFHATVFSIIFETQFFAADRDEPINSRIHNLLRLTQLENRLITSEIFDDSTPIDFNKHNAPLKTLIEKSKEYINNQLNAACRSRECS